MKMWSPLTVTRPGSLTSLWQVDYFNITFLPLLLPSLAFNTARWNPNVTGYTWPGPKRLMNNQTILQNFTCYFKVESRIFSRIWQFSCQAFRQPAPKDLPLTEIWDYDLNKHFYYIYFLKLLFIVFFEVNNFNREASKIMLFTISYFSTLWLSWLVVWR